MSARPRQKRAQTTDRNDQHGNRNLNIPSHERLSEDIRNTKDSTDQTKQSEDTPPVLTGRKKRFRLDLRRQPIISRGFVQNIQSTHDLLPFQKRRMLQTDYQALINDSKSHLDNKI